MSYDKARYTWSPQKPDDLEPLSFSEFFILSFKMIILIILTCLILIIFAALSPFNRRKVRLFIFRRWAKLVLFFCRLEVIVNGEGIGSGLMVANHISWIDILAIMSINPGKFVAKSEVRGWFPFGYFAKLANTIFIERNPNKVFEQLDLLREELLRGDLIILFPEGTSSDGQRILPFKSGLLQAGFTGHKNRQVSLAVQSLSIYYEVGNDLQRDFFAWYHTRTLLAHILKVLGARHQSKIYLTFGPISNFKKFKHRKQLANCMFKEIRGAFLSKFSHIKN